MIPTYTLSPRGVRVMGAVLLLSGLALPWVFLKTWRPPVSPVKRISTLRPELRRLPPGTFLMGSPESEEGRDDDERQHEVEIRTPFAISATEVTQGQYEQVTGSNPSKFSDVDRPVENVSWLDAVAYCNRLSEREGLTPCYRIVGKEVAWPDGLRCRGYRLPTDAEWEYAARADGRTKYAGSDALDEVVWWSGNSQGATHPVASKRANAWGLYDFTGNVWEWVWDRYESHYETLPRVDPIGPERGANRVDRGGAWDDKATDARVADRGEVEPGGRGAYLGFRVARSFPIKDLAEAAVKLIPPTAPPTHVTSTAPARPGFARRPEQPKRVSTTQRALGMGAGSPDYLEGVEDGDSTGLNAKKWKIAAFLNRIKQAVRDEWHPDEILGRHDPTGLIYGNTNRTTRLRVVLRADGRVSNLEVAVSSGVQFLDDEAMSAFRRAQPFANPPSELIENDGFIRFGFAFVCEGRNRTFQVKFEKSQ